MTTLEAVLNSVADADDPKFSWEVLSNAAGAVRVEASTTDVVPTREDAYLKAEELLAAVTAQIGGGREINDGYIGAKWDDEATGWRGHMDLNFFPPDR